MEFGEQVTETTMTIPSELQELLWRLVGSFDCSHLRTTQLPAAIFVKWQYGYSDTTRRMATSVLPPWRCRKSGRSSLTVCRYAQKLGRFENSAEF